MTQQMFDDACQDATTSSQCHSDWWRKKKSYIANICFQYTTSFSIGINSGWLQTVSDEEVAQPDCEEESIMENRWEGSERAMRPQWVKYLNRWPLVERATVPGTWSHTVILLSPWAFVATQWYSPASWICTPLICSDESGSTLDLPVWARMARPDLYHVRLWRTEPSTLQDNTATAPTEEVTLTAGFRTGGGSV